MPDGVYMDADGLAEIDLGNGTNYNPQEALKYVLPNRFCYWSFIY